ncbi:hypothetical protein L2E82_39028 [Cichorium intybus]|uniref:Uncharacterized protein n=1 Tax=Cichorium intybus TaxID=13427 RepID=A0ACB9AHV2_CICIN|nr:hypothetical protein L2E82_39028 [Cichorium intybus]
MIWKGFPDTTTLSHPTTTIWKGLQVESAKVGLAQRLSGGAIINVNQAKIAESARACCVIVSEPSRPTSGISRVLDPDVIKEIQESASTSVSLSCPIVGIWERG